MVIEHLLVPNRNNRTLLYVSGRHIFIRLASFMGIPNSVRILDTKILLGDFSAKVGKIIFLHGQLG